MKIILLSILITITFIGCNVTSSEVQPIYSNPYKHKNKSCSSLKKEIKHLGSEVSASAFNVDEAKDYQDTKLLFGWIFWPSYFIIDDNEDEAKKLALLKGKYQSLIDIIKFKNCDTKIKEINGE